MKIIFIIIFLVIISSSIQLSFQQNEAEQEQIDPWVLDYEFLKEIILILMTIIAGFLTTRHLTNKWQKNKEKAEIQKNIQKEVDDSLFHYIMLMLNIHRKIWDSYKEVTEDTRYEKGKVIDMNDTFPNNTPDEYPKQKFAKEIEEMRNELSLVDEKNEKLQSSLMLYFKSEELISDCDNILKSHGPLRIAFKKILNSENADEFNSRHDSFMELIDNIRRQTRLFKQKLINNEVKLEDKKSRWFLKRK